MAQTTVPKALLDPSLVDNNTDQTIGGNKVIAKPMTTTNITDEPNAPSSSSLLLYSKAISGRSMLKMKSPSGLDTPLQPAIFQNSIFLVSPNTTTSVSAVGGAVASAGTLSTPTPTTGSYGVTTNFATAATAAATAGTGQSLTPLNTTTTGAADNGGFFTVQRLVFIDTDYTTNPIRFFAGVTSVAITASVTSDNPAGHRAGFSLLSGETVFRFSTRDGTTESRVSTTMPFVAGHMYDFYVYFRTTGGAMEWRIDDLTAGTSISGNTTSNLPLATAAGYMRAGFQIATINAVAHNIRMKKIYVETDN